MPLWEWTLSQAASQLLFVCPMLSHRWDPWEVQFWLGTHLGSSESSTCSYPMLTWDDDRRWNFPDGTLRGISQLQMGQHGSPVPSDFIIEMWRFGITWDQMGNDLGQIRKSHEIDIGPIFGTWAILGWCFSWETMGHTWQLCDLLACPPDLLILIISSTSCHFLYVFLIGPWLIDSVAGKLVWNIRQRWDSNLDVLSSGGRCVSHRRSSYLTHMQVILLYTCMIKMVQLGCVLGLLRHLQAHRGKSACIITR